MSEDRAARTMQELGRIQTFFPLLGRLGNGWAARRPWEGLTLAANLHLTTVTAALVRELVLGGGQWVVCAASRATTDPGTVDFLRGLGVRVYTGGDLEDPLQQALLHRPQFLLDTGFALGRAAITRSDSRVAGAVELTRTGVDRLREASTPFPVVNLTDGRLREAIENRHGVGDAVWQAVTGLTGVQLSGRRVLVIGYGPVGRGLAGSARAAGTAVEVAETDPVRRLFAHYDGYPTPSLADGLARASLVVTATGKRRALTLEDLRGARDGVVVLNAGTGDDEVDVAGIRRAAVAEDHVAPQVVVYKLEAGPRVAVLGQGHPLNIVLNSGSPEALLLKYTLAGLTLAWLVAEGEGLCGEVSVPAALESEAASLALQAMDLRRAP
jgi:adenosylhomocysteinase